MHTDEIRAALDDRGVHWWAGKDERETLWESNGLTWEYFNNESGDAWLGFLGACEQDITPEQAIAATLGAGTCRMELPDLRGPAFTDVYICSECGGEVMVGTVMGESDVPKWCPWCGRKVVDE